jgi:hypothetical protein
MDNLYDSSKVYIDKLQIGTFDMVTALALMYFWVIFAYTTPLLSCDIQKLMSNSVYPKHILGLVTFFFLMVASDKNNTASLGKTWTKSIIGYLIFMLFIKSKLEVSISILVLFIIDQSIAYHIKYLKNNTENNNDEEIETYKKYRDYLYYIILIIAIGGFIQLTLYSYEENKEDFSLIKLFVGKNKCNDI